MEDFEIKEDGTIDIIDIKIKRLLKSNLNVNLLVQF